MYYLVSSVIPVFLSSTGFKFFFLWALFLGKVLSFQTPESADRTFLGGV